MHTYYFNSDSHILQNINQHIHIRKSTIILKPLPCGSMFWMRFVNTSFPVSITFFLSPWYLLQLPHMLWSEQNDPFPFQALSSFPPEKDIPNFLSRVRNKGRMRCGGGGCWRKEAKKVGCASSADGKRRWNLFSLSISRQKAQSNISLSLSGGRSQLMEEETTQGRNFRRPPSSLPRHGEGGGISPSPHLLLSWGDPFPKMGAKLFDGTRTLLAPVQF